MLSWLIPLVHASFWFGLYTRPFSPWVDHLMLVLILALLLSAFGVSWLRREAKEKLVKRMWGSTLAVCVSAALIGLVLYAITWQRIPVLGMRIFWPIWFLAHAAWGLSIHVRAKKQIPAMRRSQAERQAYEKWLPKAKK